MSLQRTTSLSTVSTTTTGSTMFTDARSAFTDAASHQGTINDNADATNSQNINNKSDEKSVNEVITTDGSQPGLNGVEVDVKTKEQDANLEPKDDSNIKTEQPQAVKEPKFVSREEKIRQIREQRRTNTNPDTEESECHEYFCSNNLIDILDLPGWRFWVCGLCTVCCNSLESSGRTTAVKTAAVR